MAIVLITLATASQGAVSTGPLANIIDISPNYSGVILGLASLITTVAGIISPYIVGKLTVGNVSTKHNFYIDFLLFYFLFDISANVATVAICVLDCCGNDVLLRIGLCLVC